MLKAIAAQGITPAGLESFKQQWSSGRVTDLIASFHREQDQQIETDIVRVFTETGNNVPGIAEPGNNVPTLPSAMPVIITAAQATQATQLPDSPPAPSDNLTNSCDSSSPQVGGVDPLQAESLDEACQLAHQLGWPRGIGVAIAERFGITRQSVHQRKQKLARG